MVTPIYSIVLAIIFILLSVRTLLLRGKLKIAVGDGGNLQMLRAMRAHANFIEYVPLVLILMILLELSKAPSPWIHTTGACIVIGRISHLFGISQLKENYLFRRLGMGMTFTSLSIAIFYHILIYLKPS
ncbi:MAG: MAPEG family protein [Spirochaetota bacterium]